MADLWSIIGIAISVALFLIGYRQTVGAKKERVTAANHEIEKILVRRVVLESYTPDIASIGRLLEGKAQAFRVRTTDLLAEEQVLNSIFSRVIESDFLPQDKREEIIRRLMPIIVQAEEGSTPQPLEAGVGQPRRALLNRTISLATMGVSASIVGSLVAIFPDVVNFDTAFPQLFSVMTLSAAIITALIVFYRLRESQQGLPSKAETIATTFHFEREVGEVIAKAGLPLKIAGAKDLGYDLSIAHGGGKMLLEIKPWSQPMPLRLIADVAERLRAAMARDGASEGIIVTPTKISVPEEIIGRGVKMMSLRELRNYLVHLGPR